MISDRRVKIVATIGPAISSSENLAKAIRSGMNVARLNFSHGTHEDHKKVIESVRDHSLKLKAPVTLLQDLQGPKVRVGKFQGGGVQIEENEMVLFSSNFKQEDNNSTTSDGYKKIPVDFEGLAEACRPSMKILLDDGLMELVVIEVEGAIVKAKVIEGGFLKDRKGMNIPEAKLPVDCLTEKDLSDLEFGLDNGVDYVALSFVRHPDDMKRLRQLVNAKRPETKIIAKIEMLEALDNLDAIIKESDAVMVARGDLAVEVGHTMLPGHQKEIIEKCNKNKCPVITATQMLDSMVNNSRPTRAEITDVANAVLDGSDALMLSAESAAGKHPFKCIRTMSEIICEVEKNKSNYYIDVDSKSDFSGTPEVIAASACVAAQKLKARVIVCLTTTGKTATMISSHRPRSRIIAVTDLQSTLSRLQLVWGIQTFAIPDYSNFDEVVDLTERLLLQYGLVSAGDKIIFTLGLPVERKEKTNAIRVHEIPDRDIELLDQSLLPLRLQRPQGH